jgi:hypothetical protein
VVFWLVDLVIVDLWLKNVDGDAPKSYEENFGGDEACGTGHHSSRTTGQAWVMLGHFCNKSFSPKARYSLYFQDHVHSVPYYLSFTTTQLSNSEAAKCSHVLKEKI